MDNSVTVSVAMCTYNGENYLKEQLESILAQTVPPSELVIGDDCSKDRTLEILYAFKGSYNFPVRIIANTKNFGVNKNFENIIARCSCEIIMLADQDDIWQPNKIEEIVSAFKDNPGCGYVFSNADLVNKEGEFLGRDLWQSIGFSQKRYRKYVGGYQLEVMLRDGNFIYGMTMAFRSAYKAILLPIESQSYACTHDTWISLMLSSIGAYGVAVPRSLVKYRQHDMQLAGGGHNFTVVRFLQNAMKRSSDVDVTVVCALMKIVERLHHEDRNNKYVSFSIEQLTHKAEHLKSRLLAGEAKGVNKLNIVLREVITRRYNRYSGSVKSIIKDLMFSHRNISSPIMHDLCKINNSTKTPNFFIVGAAKAGTSFISGYLNRHPAIYISPIKEPHFFSKDIRIPDFRLDYMERVFFDVKEYLKNHTLPRKHIAFIDDLSQYLELFREVKNEKAIGELSTGYLYSNCAAEYLFKFNPDAKIIMILRQPVERAFSHYLMNVRDFWSRDYGFINAIESDFTSSEKGWGKSHLYVELGLYYEQVSRYLKRFPESQVKVFLYEELRDDPAKFIKDLCKFLEVYPHAVPVNKVVIYDNISTVPKLKILSAYLPVLEIFRKYIFIYLSENLRKQLKRTMTSREKLPVMRQDEFEQAMKYFNDDIKKLSILIKIDLQSWHQLQK